MTCTYVKRYAQQALLNISTEDDDDAASLNGSHKSSSTAGKSVAPRPRAMATPRPLHLNQLRHWSARPRDTWPLVNLALTECHEDKEVYNQRIRTIMRLKLSASVAPRTLTRTMTMAQYMEIFGYYSDWRRSCTKRPQPRRCPMEPHPRRNRHPSQRGRPLGRVRHQTLRRTHLHLHQGAPQTPTPPSGIANDCGRKSRRGI